MVQGGGDAHESADRAGDRRSATLDADAEGTRFDRALAAIFPDLSRSRLQALIREGAVRCDGAALLDPSRKVAAGMQVELLVPAAAAPEPRAEALPLVVVHEDDDLLVIDKPAELAAWLRNAGLQLEDVSGMLYEPWRNRARLSSRTEVNYLAYAVKP